ncbi:MAG: Fur family transcriptional regulator [Thermoanaerobaculia bacterium]
MTETVEERRLFADFLRRRGLKTTRERTALFEEIFATHHHFDADDLVVRLRGKGKKVSRATVYRTLDLLYDCGLVSRVRLNDEKYRYERLLVGEHHDHLVCTSCGGVIEFVDPRIEELQEAVCKRYSFAATTHSHQIRGVCAECQAREGKSGRGATA